MKRINGEEYLREHAFNCLQKKHCFSFLESFVLYNILPYRSLQVKARPQLTYYFIIRHDSHRALQHRITSRVSQTSAGSWPNEARCITRTARGAWALERGPEQSGRTSGGFGCWGLEDWPISWGLRLEVFSVKSAWSGLL